MDSDVTRGTFFSGLLRCPARAQGWHLPWDTCGPGPHGVPVVSPGCPRFLARSGKKGVFCVFFVYI